MFVSWFFGITFILGGIGWMLLAWFAAGMVSRSPTWWESTGSPLMGLIPLAIGVAIIVWR